MCERNLVAAPADYDYAQQYRDAVALGSQFSMVYYGAVLQRDGKFREAATHYGKSSRLGFAPAKFLLALCLRRGEGVRRDEAAATRVMTSAAKQLYSHAMLDVANTVMINERRHDADAFAMLKHVQKMVDATDRACAYLTFLPPPNPHSQLMICYAQGRGVRGDHVNALQHLSLSLRISEVQEK
jgi:TPR repeat protein